MQRQQMTVVCVSDGSQSQEKYSVPLLRRTMHIALSRADIGPTACHACVWPSQCALATVTPAFSA